MAFQPPRLVTRYEAYIEKNWSDHGLAYLVVARLRANGSADYGVFLVDTWCLGVKDAFGGSDILETEYREEVAGRLPEALREPIHPNCARKLIDGAVAYAERLGFAPHRDFRKAKRVLTGLDAALCPTEFVFGREGRPCYVQGANDTEERVDRVLAVLEARLGAEGFDYELADDAEDEVEDDPEDAAEDARGSLLMFFENEPAGGPTFFEMSGLLTAMLICPTVLPPSKLLEALWGPAGRVWENGDDLRDFLDDIRVYWNFLADVVGAGAAEDSVDSAFDLVDIFPEDLDRPEELVGAHVLWCRGFLRATQAWPEAWGGALSRPELAHSWRVVRAWADPERAENVEFLTAGAGTDAASRPDRNLPRAVALLARTLRGPEAARGIAP